MGFTIIRTPINPTIIAVHLLLLTTSPKINIDNKVVNIGDAKVSDTVVANGK